MFKKFIMAMFIIGIGVMLTSQPNAFAQERCFTFTGNVRDRAPSPDIVASMGDAWIGSTAFSKDGVVEGQAMSYDFCVSYMPNGDMARLVSSSIGSLAAKYGAPTVGSHPDGYPKPTASYNFIYYGEGQNYILVGTDDEYIMVHHDGMMIDQWEVNKPLTLTHSHHSLVNMPLTYNGVTHYDWVSRIYVDGWISEIDPMPVQDSDGDGYSDDVDNCPNIPNDQMDMDGDGIGDFCDPFPSCGDPNGDCGPEPITFFPDLGCENVGDDTCVGRYSIDQMGSFDIDGIWIWNTEFVSLMESWSYSNPSNYPELWTPIKESGLITDGPWQNTDYRLDRRVYSDGREFSMLNLLIQTGTSVKYPTVYLSDDNGNQWISIWQGPINWPDGTCVWPDNTDPHENCDGTNPNMEADGDPWNDISPDNPVICCRPFGDAMENPWIDQIESQELTEDRVNFVRWENTGEIEYGPKSYDGGMFTMLNYDLMSNGGNNMWLENWTRSYSQNAPTIRFHFPTVISAIGDQTFTINYDEGIEGQLTIFASDITNMPVIPEVSSELVFLKVKKNGKIKERTKMVNHVLITVREVVDPLNPDAGNALVVQWPEPEEALFGGMQLRVYVGPEHAQQDPTMTLEENHSFLFLDAPAQAGTVVFPQETWEAYKAEQIVRGQTEMNMTIMYRINSDHYQNRSNSGMTFQIQ